MTVLARRTGPTWDLIDKLLTGVGMPPGYDVPKSVQAFNQIGNLPDETVCQLLTRCVAGAISLTDMQAECKKSKWRIRIREMVKELIVDTAKLRSRSTLVLLPWPELCGLYPLSTQEGMLESFIQEVSLRPKSDGPPPSLRSTIARLLAIDEKTARTEVLFVIIVS